MEQIPTTLSTPVILNEIQSRILLGILLASSSKTETEALTVREIVDFCGKTSNGVVRVHCRKLETIGLVRCEVRKMFDGYTGVIVRRIFVSLTPKGRLVARLLLDTSNTGAAIQAA